MSSIDLVLALILLAFAISGYQQGMLRQAANLAGLALGLVLAMIGSPYLAEAFAPAGSAGTLLISIAFLTIFLGTWIAANVVGFWLHRRAKQRDDHDAWAGFLLGLCGGILVLVLLAAGVAWMSSGLEQTLRASLIGAWLLDVSARMLALLS